MTTYYERVTQSRCKTMTGTEIFNLRNAHPIYSRGIQLPSYEVETLFRESRRQWLTKYDELESGEIQLIIIRQKF